MIASATQITPKSIRATLLLLLHIIRVRNQLKTAEGLLKVDFARGWTTLTIWRSLEEMKAFRNTGAHLAAMRETGRIGTARTTTWETNEFPTWTEVHKRLGDDGAS